MVLESLITPWKAEKKPWELIFIGFAYASIALFLSLLVFEEYASLVMIFLTALAAVPLLYLTIKFEESKHIVTKSEVALLKEHSKAVSFLLFLFIGASIAYALWYVVLPGDVTATLFSAQTDTITSLNQRVIGKATELDILSKIFLNNIKVLIFCILFSFIYGSGGIFILMWNASVIGVALGNFFRARLAEVTAAAGWSTITSYLYATSLSVLRYAIHGVPEILAYIIAGLAGGIISVAVIRHNFSTRNFERILLDSSDLILTSIFMLFVAALLEVYVTPLFF